MKSLILALLISSMCFAEPLATHLTINQKTPYEGLLLNKEGSAKINIMISEYSAAKSALITQNDMLINAQKQIVQYEFQIIELKSNNESSDFWTKVLYGVGGILIGSVVTSVVVHGK